MASESMIHAEGLTKRYGDTVALFQALGGGWWNRSDSPVSATQGIS